MPMNKDDTTPEIRDMMRTMLEMVMPEGEAPKTNDKPTQPLPPITRKAYMATPERQELYRKVCAFVKTQERINESMLEEQFELSYCTVALFTDQMKDDGLISREKDEDYMYRKL